MQSGHKALTVKVDSINLKDEPFNIEHGKVLFDNIKASFIFPFIKFINDTGEEYYKIYNNETKFQYYIDKEIKLFLLVNRQDKPKEFNMSSNKKTY